MEVVEQRGVGMSIHPEVINYNTDSLSGVKMNTNTRHTPIINIIMYNKYALILNRYIPTNKSLIRDHAYGLSIN